MKGFFVLSALQPVTEPLAKALEVTNPYPLCYNP